MPAPVSGCIARRRQSRRSGCLLYLLTRQMRRTMMRRLCRLLLPPIAGYDAAEDSPPLLLPLLARPSLYAPTPPVILRRWQPHTAVERVNPHTPLRVGIHCRVFPGFASSPFFLGLAVVHRPGALGAAWSTWSRNGFHRTWTVHGEADSWVHGRSEEVPPYYAQNNYSST